MTVNAITDTKKRENRDCAYLSSYYPKQPVFGLFIHAAKWLQPFSVIHDHWSSLKTGTARPGHVEIAVDITAVDINLFFLYSTGTMIM